MKDAKMKAEDYVSVIDQKVGVGFTITDNTQTFYPQPVYAMKTMAMDGVAGAPPTETLVVGEIEIIANLSVSFKLE